MFQYRKGRAPPPYNPDATPVLRRRSATVRRNVRIRRQVATVVRTVEVTATRYIAIPTANIQAVAAADVQSFGSGPFATNPLAVAAPTAAAPLAVPTFVQPQSPAEARSYDASPTGVVTTGEYSERVPLSQKPDNEMAKWSKALIAVAVVGGLLLLAFTIMLVYRYKTGRSPLSSLRRKPRQEQQYTREPYSAVQRGAPWNSSAVWPSVPEKPTWEYTSSSGSLYKPNAVYIRPDTAGSSNGSVLGLGLHQQPSRSPFPPPNRMDYSSSPLVDRGVWTMEAKEEKMASPQEKSRRASSDASTLLPIEGPRTKQISSKGSPNSHKQTPPKKSRFSWTNSQAPRTPPQPDNSRFSSATSVSSVARFRTVDSWVGNQTNRLEERKIQKHFEKEIAAQMGVPVSPESVSASKGLASPKGKRGYYHGDNEHSEYMQHPGTQVRVQSGQRIPSEILDKKLGPRAL